MKLLKKYFLPATVFLTGASVLVVEVAAVRILSPYYGSTLFTVSSVITVILLALSLGYYYGGKMADKDPSQRRFFGIIMISGLLLLGLHLIGSLVLPIVSLSFSIAMGPLVSSAVLFLLPAFLLGMLSPFAIKLQSDRFPELGVGTVAGMIFFWSTLGSILGSLLAGFVLVPTFGIDRIMIVNSVLLVMLGLIPLVRAKYTREHAIVSAAILGALLFGAVTLLGYQDPSVVYAKDGMYEKITIKDGVYDGRATRFFQQDRSMSGGMFLDSDDPTDLVFEYTKYYKLYKIFTPDIDRALVIGGGAYSVPKALLAELPDVQVDVSEIEPSLLELSEEYFDVPKSERLFNTTEDGRRWLADTTEGYDQIFSDVYYSLYSIPTHFTTVEFFETAKAALAPGGVFIANLIGNLSRSDESLLMAEMKTFQSVFPNFYIFAVESDQHLSTQNMMFVGINGDERIDIAARLAESDDEFLNSLADKVIDVTRFELSEQTLLTDNYAPVDHLNGKLVKRSFSQRPFFDGEEMLGLIAQQLRYGPRHLSAEGHQSMHRFLQAELWAFADDVLVQEWEYMSANERTYTLKNFIGRLNPEAESRVILATHYDSKKHAHFDVRKPAHPVPGANDSASGVAVLLDLIRLFATTPLQPNVGIDFVFFDGEEGEEDIGGDFTHWSPLGSEYFVTQLDTLYDSTENVEGIVLDMVCDKDLEIVPEAFSIEAAPEQVKAFWRIANAVDDDAFGETGSVAVRDDHSALNAAGIPTFLLIDFTYPPFHTTKDTIDKCSAESLATVSEAVYRYVYTLK